MKTYICILVLVFLSACAPYPQYSYYELDEAIKTAPTEEEREYHEQRRDKIEHDAAEAGEFLMAMQRCIADAYCQIWCDWHEPRPHNVVPENEDVDDVDKLVRWYRLVRPPTCGFIQEGDMQ